MQARYSISFVLGAPGIPATSVYYASRIWKPTAYAADGYARVNGMAVVDATFGAGELSAMNGNSGALHTVHYIPAERQAAPPYSRNRGLQRLCQYKREYLLRHIKTK